MTPFTKLLVPTDFSPTAERAAAYAVRLAEGFGAEVLLVHAFAFPYDWYYWEVPELDALRRAVEESAEEKLRTLAERLACPGVLIRPRLVVRSGIVRAVLETAEAEDSDLVVMGTTGWTGERPALGSVAEQVTRQSTRPVLMVHRDVSAHSERPRILVPVDLSEASAKALALGSALGTALGGQVEVVHVLPDEPFQAEYLGDEPVDAGDPLSREQRARAVERFCEEHAGAGGPVEVHFAEGDVLKEAARYAERERADLVVLGLSGRDHLHKAERLALAAPCPVLAVPAPVPNLSSDASTAPEATREAAL